MLSLGMTMKTTGGFTSDRLREQSEKLTLSAFDSAHAVELGERALAIARPRELPVTIEVWHVGRLMFKAALPGTSPDNDEWLRRKRNVTERFDNSTLAVRVKYEERGEEFNEATSLPLDDYAAHGGGWPIRVRGVGTVGFFGISGLPQVEDHAFIVECLTAFAESRALLA